MKCQLPNFQMKKIQINNHSIHRHHLEIKKLNYSNFVQTNCFSRSFFTTHSPINNEKSTKLNKINQFKQISPSYASPFQEITKLNFSQYNSFFRSTTQKNGRRFYSKQVPNPLILEFESTDEEIRRNEEEKKQSVWRHLFWIFPIITAFLAIWQFERRKWKEELIAFRQNQLSAPVIELPDELVEFAVENKTTEELSELIEQFEFRKYETEGTFLNQYRFCLGPRTFNNTVGVQIITPFLISSSGKVIFVNRGFIPEKLKHDPQYVLEGNQKIVGIVRKPMLPGTYTPANEPQNNQWFWLDTKEMTKMITEYQPSSISQIVLDLTLDNNTAVKYPVAGQSRIDLPNNHLNYMVTWGSLTVFLSYFCITISRGKRI